MLVSCQLCLMRRVVNAPEKLQILSDASNQERLAQLQKKHVDEYGIPASPWHLAREFEMLNLPAGPSSTPSGGRGAATRKRPAACIGIKAPEAPALPLASGEQQGQGKPAEAPVPLASQEQQGQGHPSGVRFKWYPIPIPSTGKKSQCQCKGNCNRGCPASWSRTMRRGGKRPTCPNPATWNLGKGGRTRKFYNTLVPLCQACVCQNEKCKSGARRPYKEFAQPCNYGRCRRCWDATT